MQLIDGRPVFSATDLVGFLACEHLAELERSALAGLVPRPVRTDPELDRVRIRGEEHEERYLVELEAAGRLVTRLRIPDDAWRADRSEALGEAASATRAAILRGDDVIHQACFFDGRWLGFADFLLRVEPAPDRSPPPLGWSYEVADTKLARSAKASALLQICSYVEQLAPIQGCLPARMHVALGGSQRLTESFRVADGMAYYRAVKRRFERLAANPLPRTYPPPGTYPEPVPHCDVCRWAEVCAVRRRGDDDLSLVAGIAGRTRKELKERRGVRTRRGLAALPLRLEPPLERTSGEAFARVREQARAQVVGEDRAAPYWELIDPPRLADGSLEPGKGLLGLPEPAAGDLFLDLEGDPFALDDGVDYLFGILEPGVLDAAGRPTYHRFWARDDDGRVTADAERRAFEAAVDLISGRLAADPAIHVYHYAPYEPTALGRLMGRYATREVAIEQLKRGRTLVDLYRIVRQGIRASVESYSIKRLEAFYGYQREVDLRDAGSSIVAFETWLEVGGESGSEPGILERIERYNRDDVVSTWKLRDWLEERRRDLEDTRRCPLPRPAPGSGDEPERLAEWLRQVREVQAPLLAGLPEDEATRRGDPAANARWLLAQLLGWHRREQRFAWWRFFHLVNDLTDEERVDEREPIGLLEPVGVVDEARRTWRYRFPPQEHDIEEGTAPVDPATRKDLPVESIDDQAHEIVLRFPKKRDISHPRSLVPDGVVRTGAQEESLLKIARSATTCGIDGDGPYRAARDLLMRRLPRIVGRSPGSALCDADQAPEAAARAHVVRLDETTLPIQGPPGSGKTWTGARMVLDLVFAGKRVGVTASSHKVIGKLLDDVCAAASRDARFADRPVRIGQKPADGEAATCASATTFTDHAKLLGAMAAGALDVVGGTAWVWARPEFESTLDVLVIDEAGQFSLANAVAVSPAAASLVLLGDPQQLDQVVSGSHPPGAERSALAHILDGEPTMPADRGLFLEETWRLHPSICGYTSEAFYDGRLRPRDGNQLQAVVGPGPLAGAGIRYEPVAHAGDDTDSPDEARRVADIVAALLASGPTWIDWQGRSQPMGQAHILVVAPYNAHRTALRRALLERGLADIQVGTVDRFQGQQAPISIYSMASSSAEDAPRGMEFLYSLNRLNVATSRARCVTLVVASPELVRVQVRTPHQMRLANALCRLVEMAGD